MSETGAQPKPYTVRRHFDRSRGVTTYTVAIQGTQDIAGGIEFYVPDEAQRYADQRNAIEGREQQGGNE